MKIVKHVTPIFNVGIKLDMYPYYLNNMFPRFTGYAKGGEANKHILDYLIEFM